MQEFLLEEKLLTKKYHLWVSMNTDDDLKIIYEGEEYCYYGNDLHISKYFRTIEACKEHLREIEILPKYKASDMTQEFIDDFINDINVYEYNDTIEKSYSGNQEYLISITKMF